MVFVPYKDKRTVIGKRTKVDSGSVMYGGVEIGNDCIVGHNTVIRFNVKIGNHSTIGNLCMLEGNTTIGHHTLIHSNNHIGQKTTIGNYVFVAPLSVTTNDPKMVYYRQKGRSETGVTSWDDLCGPTIEDYVRIAVGVIIFPKIVVGEHAVLGAGAIVTKSIPPYAVVIGSEIKKYIKPEDDIVYECQRDHR